MTSPIKPPGDGPPGPSSPDGPGGPSGPGKPKPAEGPSEAFRETLEGASEGPASEQVAGSDALQSVADDLRAGRIDAAQAVDRLVQRALEAAPEALPPAARAELEAHLRRALAEDPSLSALTKDLERGK